MQNAYGYGAFGELDYQLGTIDSKYLFTGEQYDNNFGFYYLRARYYNPSNGRFTQMDTFQGMMHEPKTLHKYLYTHADPVNNIDPSGNIFIGHLMAGLRIAAKVVAYGQAFDFVTHAHINGLAHQYEFKNKICKIGTTGCTKENVFFALRHFPAPVTKVQLADDNTLSNLWGIPGQKNDVTHTIEMVGFIVKNITEPSHVFHDGTVERRVIAQDGYLQIHSVGVGENTNTIYAWLNAKMAPAVFAWPDARIKAVIESGELDNLEAHDGFGFLANFCYVGVFCF